MDLVLESVISGGAGTPAAAITGPSAWQGATISAGGDWIYHLSSEEREEIEAAGARFLQDDPDVRVAVAEQYPLPATARALRAWSEAMETGRGFVLVRGLRSDLYSDALSSAIFFVLGLHLGEPMRQNELGDVLGHVTAAPEAFVSDPNTLGSRSRNELSFHSDSSDIVGLLCLRGAKEGGASVLLSGATIYNEVLGRRPDLAPLLFETWHWDWARQDHSAPVRYYSSPMCSYVDGVFSMYAGVAIIRSAQDYPEVPRLTPAQWELLDLLDDICLEPDLPLAMDFRPGDIQWLSNYAALHSRSAYDDYKEPARKRHLMRLWLKQHVRRPLVTGFGRNVVKGRGEVREAEVPPHLARFQISQCWYPRDEADFRETSKIG